MSTFCERTLIPSREELCRFHFGSLEDLETKSGKYFIACSGGLDSMVLLDLFASWIKGSKIELSVLHVNYGLRGEESNGDEAFVREQAKLRGLSCQVLNVEKDSQPLSGIQDWARQIRYDWFGKLSKTGEKVLLAHHRDDLIETILMRIMRGSGLSALQGMKPNQGVYWRPFLDLPRKSIQEIAQREKILHREDSSNAKLDYSRNRVRGLILPELETMFPGASQNLLELARAGQDWANLHQEILPSLKVESSEDWRKLGFYPASQIILQRIGEAKWAKDVSRSWLETVYQGLIDGANTVVQLDPEHQVRLVKGQFTLERNNYPVSPRWQQYAKELTRSGLAAHLSPGTRLEADLDASSEMQDNKDIIQQDELPSKRSP